jgi:hypothetical protein
MNNYINITFKDQQGDDDKSLNIIYNYFNNINTIFPQQIFKTFKIVDNFNFSNYRFFIDKILSNDNYQYLNNTTKFDIDIWSPMNFDKIYNINSLEISGDFPISSYNIRNKIFRIFYKSNSNNIIKYFNSSSFLITNLVMCDINFIIDNFNFIVRKNFYPTQFKFKDDLNFSQYYSQNDKIEIKFEIIIEYEYQNMNIVTYTPQKLDYSKFYNYYIQLLKDINYKLINYKQNWINISITKELEGTYDSWYVNWFDILIEFCIFMFAVQNTVDFPIYMSLQNYRFYFNNLSEAQLIPTPIYRSLSTGYEIIRNKDIYRTIHPDSMDNSTHSLKSIFLILPNEYVNFRLFIRNRYGKNRTDKSLSIYSRLNFFFITYLDYYIKLKSEFNLTQHLSFCYRKKDIWDYFLSLDKLSVATLENLKLFIISSDFELVEDLFHDRRFVNSIMPVYIPSYILDLFDIEFSFDQSSIYTMILYDSYISYYDLNTPYNWRDFFYGNYGLTKYERELTPEFYKMNFVKKFILKRNNYTWVTKLAFRNSIPYDPNKDLYNNSVTKYTGNLLVDKYYRDEIDPIINSLTIKLIKK